MAFHRGRACADVLTARHPSEVYGRSRVRNAPAPREGIACMLTGRRVADDLATYSSPNKAPGALWRTDQRRAELVECRLGAAPSIGSVSVSSD